MKNNICNSCNCEIDYGKNMCFKCRQEKLDNLKIASRALKLHRKCLKIDPTSGIPSPAEWCDNCIFYCKQYEAIMHNSLINELSDSDCFLNYYAYLYKIFKDYI